MTKFCAEWPNLSVDQRRQFYADVLYSIAKPESAYSRASMYWESGQGTDEITGLQIKTSEGFLQLSYDDILGYGHACDFSYAIHDKPFHLDDIAHKPASKSWNGLHPNEKYIQDGPRNLTCGVAIFDTLLKNHSGEFADVMSLYWSTMRRSGAAYSTIWGQMRSRNSPCH